MKIKQTILTALLALVTLTSALPAHAQTNQLPSLFPHVSGNLPPYDKDTTLFTSGKLEFRVAAQTGNSYEAINSLTYFVTQGFGLTGDCVNGGVNNLDAIHFGGEYAYPVGGIRFTGRAVGGLNLVTHRPEGVLSLFLSYVPLNAAPNFFMFGGPSITIDKTTFKSNGTGLVNAFAGFGYRF